MRVWLSLTKRSSYVCLGFLAFLFVCNLSGCAAPPVTPLRVATLPWPGYESLHLAQGLGAFSEDQVRLVQLTNNSQTTQAFRDGTVDAALTTLDEALSLRQEGIDVRVALVMDVSNGADVVMARPEIKSLMELRGMRIGVDPAAVGAVMLDAVLVAADLNPSDVKLVALSINEHESGYTHGLVDAVVTFEPIRSKLLDRGAHILFDSSQIPGRIVDVLVVRTETIPKHRQALAALVAGHFMALDYFAKNPQESAKRLAPFLGVTVDKVLPQFEGLKLTDLNENRRLLSGSTPALNKTAADLAVLMWQHHLLLGEVSTDNLIDASFVDSIKP